MQHIWRHSVTIKAEEKMHFPVYTVHNHIGLLKMIRRRTPQQDVYRSVFEDWMHDTSLIHLFSHRTQRARSVYCIFRITNNIGISEKLATYVSTLPGSCLYGRTNLLSVTCSSSTECVSCEHCFRVFGHGMVTSKRTVKTGTLR